MIRSYAVGCCDVKSPSPAAEPRPLPETGRGYGWCLSTAQGIAKLERKPNKHLAPFRGEVAALPRVRGLCFPARLPIKVVSEKNHMAIRHIALPSGGSEVTGDVERVATGAVQFGNDWPGLFIRGDRAIHLAHCIEYVESHIERVCELVNRRLLVLGELEADHLDMAKDALSFIRRIIEEEVRV
jgi:hypothetical protein